MSLYLASDHHFGHARIADYAGRPHTTIDAMHADLIDRWNDTITPGDDVWVLGDFALGRLGESLPLARRLHGHKHLLPGNHDRCWPGHRHYLPARRRYLDAGFESILDDPSHLWLADTHVVASHFPYLGDGPNESYDQRYAAWRPADTGRWLVHGHVHQHWRTRGRQINVGVDAWAGYPVPAATIAAYVAADQPAHEAPWPWTTP
jgi:calcineurin-like phosphoesterase family protein